MTRDVARLRNRTFDLLVIGGGIYGLVIAADAAARGLSVALVERDDFGSGSSFNHLRTIHGGLRYLQSVDLARARESIAERRTLARIAPHAVQPLAFVLPLTAGLLRGPLAMRVGFLLDTLVSRDRNEGVPDTHRLPPGRVVGPSEARRLYPAAADGRHAVAVWHDYVVTEADRLTFAWAVAAASDGAVLVNHAKATELLVDGARISGARVTDTVGGETLDVAARVVVNATGGTLDAVLGPRLETGMPVLCAMNVVTRLDGGPTAVGGYAGGRTLFLVPWQGRALVGTWEATPRQDEAARERDLEAFLTAVRTAFPGRGVTRDDVTLVHRGLVPAVRHADGRLTLDGRQRVHDHARGTPPVEGLLSVAGTKYTTARATAARVTDRVLQKLARAPVPCGTAGRALATVAPDLARAGAGDSSPGTPPADIGAHLAAAYGSGQTAVWALAHERPDLGERLAPDGPVIGAQIAWAARHEMAVTLADAVLRRTRLGALGHPGPAALARAARIMAFELGWGADRVAREIGSLEAFYQRSRPTPAHGS